MAVSRAKTDDGDAVSDIDSGELQGTRRMYYDDDQIP